MIFRILLIAGLLTSLLVGCNSDKTPEPVLCKVITITDQLEVNGRMTDQMQRTFTYTDGQLTQIGERNTDREVSLKLDYNAAGAVIKASDGVLTITLNTASGSTQPVSATSTRAGNVQSTYEMTYNAAKKLTRILETRQVIPANTFVRSREYTFVYDADGILKTEKLTATLLDRTTIEQETDYTYDVLINPMVNFTQSGLMTVVALSQLVETMPGRFWQQRVVQEYKIYTTRNSTRSPVSESATFITKKDENGRLSGQEQNTMTTSASGQTTQRKNKHTFIYLCK